MCAWFALGRYDWRKTHAHAHTLNVQRSHSSMLLRFHRVSSETWSLACWKLALHLLSEHPVVSGVAVYFSLVCHPGRNAWQWEDSVCDSCPDNYSVCLLIFSSWLFKQMLWRYALKGICVFLLMSRVIYLKHTFSKRQVWNLNCILWNNCGDNLYFHQQFCHKQLI